MKWPDRGVTGRAKNAQTPLLSKANAMIKIKRPPNVPQVPSIPSEVPETLHALRHSSTFAKIREQVSRFRFPEAAKKAIIGWRHKNIEEPETPPATPAALKEKTTATGRKPLEIQHFDEAYAALQEARKTRSEPSRRLQPRGGLDSGAFEECRRPHQQGAAQNYQTAHSRAGQNSLLSFVQSGQKSG